MSSSSQCGIVTPEMKLSMRKSWQRQLARAKENQRKAAKEKSAAKAAAKENKRRSAWRRQAGAAYHDVW
jgi:hypothetical protein